MPRSKKVNSKSKPDTSASTYQTQSQYETSQRPRETVFPFLPRQRTDRLSSPQMNSLYQNTHNIFGDRSRSNIMNPELYANVNSRSNEEKIKDLCGIFKEYHIDEDVVEAVMDGCEGDGKFKV